LSGPRTGLGGPGGGAEFPWRFWIPGEPTVSPYKKHPKA
jgi:DNA-3-methyladenine glycosylase